PYPGRQPTGNGIQALIAPEVQNTYNNGLGRDKLLGDFAMIDILIPAWDFQQVDDRIVLHWGTFFSQTFNYSGTPGAQLVRFAGSDLAGDPVPGSDRFTGDGTHQVWYELITAGGNPYSDAVDITVKCARPGGIDPRPDTPNINENLRPATCTPNPIDESAIMATFTILPWDNMERDDTLSLYIAGRSFPGEAVVVGRPQEIELSTAELRNWITPGPAVPVTYEIIDRVGNRSRFAPYLDLDMWLPKEPQLEAPAFFDANGHELPGPLDPGMGTLLVRVPRYLGWVTGEHVTVNLVGYDADHNRDARDLPLMTWKATDYYLDAWVPDDVLPGLGGGMLLAGYTTTRDDRPGTSVASYLRQIQVVDGPVSKLPAVSLPAEKDGKLILPDNDGDVVDIVVPDSTAMVEYARVTLRMSGAASKTQTRDIAQGDGHKPLTFHWTRADLAPAIDASVTFTYTIEVRGRTEVYESEPHTVRVLTEDVVDPPDRLPAPRITGLVGGVLLPTLPELEVIVPIGEASVKDALVTVIATGASTERRTTRLFGREEATVQFDGWPAQNDGMEAIVSYEIQPPSGAKRTSEETTFRVGDVTDEPYFGVKYQIEDFELPSSSILVNTPVRFRLFRVDASGATVHQVNAPANDAPYLTGRCLRQDYPVQNEFKLTFNFPTRRFRLGISSYTRIRVHADDGTVLMEQGYARRGWINFDEPLGKRAAYVVIRYGGQNFQRYVDNVLIGTGEEWNTRDAPFTETFNGFDLGFHGSDVNFPRWRVLSSEQPIYVVEGPDGVADRSIAIQLGKTSNLHYLVPRFAINPRFGIALRFRSHNLPAYAVVVYVAYIDHVTLLQRVVNKTVTIRPDSTLVILDAAKADEYVAYLAVYTSHADETEMIYYDEIRFLAEGV
ncbi:MAG: hypothetical protein WBW32_04465, partial [Luteibacter sp.]